MVICQTGCHSLGAKSILFILIVCGEHILHARHTRGEASSWTWETHSFNLCLAGGRPASTNSQRCLWQLSYVLLCWHYCTTGMHSEQSQEAWSQLSSSCTRERRHCSSTVWAGGVLGQQSISSCLTACATMRNEFHVSIAQEPLSYDISSTSCTQVITTFNHGLQI